MQEPKHYMVCGGGGDLEGEGEGWCMIACMFLLQSQNSLHGCHERPPVEPCTRPCQQSNYALCILTSTNDHWNMASK